MYRELPGTKLPGPLDVPGVGGRHLWHYFSENKSAEDAGLCVL